MDALDTDVVNVVIINFILKALCEVCCGKARGKENCNRWQRIWFACLNPLVSAGLNIVINNIAACFNIALLLPPALRIIFGPLPAHFVVCVYYLIRINFTFTITILTARMILMIAFILDFNTMSGKMFYQARAKSRRSQGVCAKLGLSTK